MGGLTTEIRCAGCSSVYYCGGKCQVQDWKDHKLVCAELKTKKEMDKVSHPQPAVTEDDQNCNIVEEEENDDDDEEEEKPGEHSAPFDEYSSEPDVIIPSCALCGITKDSTECSKLLRCTGCKKMYYCSREHQKTHWKAHKYIC